MVAELGFEVDDLCLREGVIKTTQLFGGYIPPPPSPYMEKINGFRKEKFRECCIYFIFCYFLAEGWSTPAPPDREHFS